MTLSEISDITKNIPAISEIWKNYFDNICPESFTKRVNFSF
jgi:hypothetical protein